MSLIDRVGYDETWERDLFLLSISEPEELPPELSLSTSRFICLIAWDARRSDIKAISSLARQLLDAGAVYVCAWGPDCERVHDIIDQQRDEPTVTAPPDSVVMTTWHDGESLAETLRFVLAAALPDEPYQDGCGSTLGLSIGSPEWAAEIRDAFARPGDFVRQWSIDP